MEKDVVVIGSGGGGLAAAVFCAHHGLDVLVVEKTDSFGGTTAWSGGNVWAPGNSLAKRQGLQDDESSALHYLRSVVGEDLDEALAREFLAAAPEMVDFFQDHTELQFEVQRHFSDNHMALPGARAVGRCVTPLPFDGRRLGELLPRLREPLEQINAPFGLMISFDDIEHLKNVSRSFSSFWHIARLLLRLQWDKLRYARGTRLTMGNALVARLLYAARDKGVTLWRNTPATRLLTSRGTVTGAVIKKSGQEITVRARKGVLLASGGFSASREMRRRFFPFPDQHITLMAEGNTGDGISMALEIGAVLDSGNRHNAEWVVVSAMTGDSGKITTCLHTVLDRPKPGCIAISRQGRRFVNEAARDMAAEMQATGAVPAFLVCDHRFLKKYGLGLVRPGGWGAKKAIAAGYLVQGASLGALSRALGLNDVAFEETVTRFNRFALNGRDEEFGKGDSDEDRANGDPDHSPNPCLGTIDLAPFFALRIVPGDASSWVGLKINGKAQVIGDRGRPIDGLFASGLDANSLWRGNPPSLGSNNTLSMTLGYMAARAMTNSGD